MIFRSPQLPPGQFGRVPQGVRQASSGGLPPKWFLQAVFLFPHQNYRKFGILSPVHAWDYKSRDVSHQFTANFAVPVGLGMGVVT